MVERARVAASSSRVVPRDEGTNRERSPDPAPQLGHPGDEYVARFVSRGDARIVERALLAS